MIIITVTSKALFLDVQIEGTEQGCSDVHWFDLKWVSLLLAFLWSVTCICRLRLLRLSQGYGNRSNCARLIDAIKSSQVSLFVKANCQNPGSAPTICAKLSQLQGVYNSSNSWKYWLLEISWNLTDASRKFELAYCFVVVCIICIKKTLINSSSKISEHVLGWGHHCLHCTYRHFRLHMCIWYWVSIIYCLVISLYYIILIKFA